MDIEKVISYVKERYSDEFFRDSMRLMQISENIMKDMQADGEVVRTAAMLYRMGVDHAYDALVEMDFPLTMAERICNCINTGLFQTTPERDVVMQAVMLLRLEKEADQ